MAQNYIQSGDVLEYTVPAATTIASGQVVVAGDLVGVAMTSGTTGDIISVRLSGVFEVAKEAPLEIAQGDTVYWDAANSRVDKTNTNVLMGKAFEGAGSAATLVKVRLFT